MQAGAGRAGRAEEEEGRKDHKKIFTDSFAFRKIGNSFKTKHEQKKEERKVFERLVILKIFFHWVFHISSLDNKDYV